MKTSWRYDDRRDLGPATDGVRTIVALWQRIDWFTEPAPGAFERARCAFEKHLARTRAHAPGAYAPAMRFAPRIGTWPDFAALVRTATGQSGFDWKFGVLKPLLHAHRERLGFHIDASHPGVVPITELRADAPMPLYAALPNGTTITLGPHVGATGDALFAASPRAAWQRATNYRPAIGWYTSYASQDAAFAVEWQLAAAHAVVDDNPFVPLLETYDAGAYPFVTSASEVVFFSFRQPTLRDALFPGN